MKVVFVVKVNIQYGLVGILAAIFCLLAPSAFADVYAFTDQQGVLHLTDAPDDQRYRRVLNEPRLVLPGPATPAESSTAASNGLQDVVNRESLAEKIDPALVHAVIRAESNYNPVAVSSKGARGLMQLMPDTARRYGVSDAFDPEQNIRAGVRHLAMLMGRFGNDLRLVLAAYNAGEGAVAAYGNRIPPYRETLQYVPRVLEYYSRYQARRRVTGSI